MPNFTIKVVPLDKQGRNSFIEVLRLYGDYLFDKLYITKFGHVPSGVEVQFDYERGANRLRDLPTIVVDSADFAISRGIANAPATVDGKREAWATTPLVARLFAEGASHYNEQNKKAESDFAADTEFIAALSTPPAVV